MWSEATTSAAFSQTRHVSETEYQSENVREGNTARVNAWGETWETQDKARESPRHLRVLRAALAPGVGTGGRMLRQVCTYVPFPEAPFAWGAGGRRAKKDQSAAR